MDHFEFKIIGKRNEDGTGSVSWRHTAADGKEYGDYVLLKDFDAEYEEAVGVIATQAVMTLQVLNEDQP